MQNQCIKPVKQSNVIARCLGLLILFIFFSMPVRAIGDDQLYTFLSMQYEHGGFFYDAKLDDQCLTTLTLANKYISNSGGFSPPLQYCCAGDSELTNTQINNLNMGACNNAKQELAEAVSRAYYIGLSTYFKSEVNSGFTGTSPQQLGTQCSISVPGAWGGYNTATFTCSYGKK